MRNQTVDGGDLQYLLFALENHFFFVVSPTLQALFVVHLPDFNRPDRRTLCLCAIACCFEVQQTPTPGWLPRRMRRVSLFFLSGYISTSSQGGEKCSCVPVFCASYLSRTVGYCRDVSGPARSSLSFRKSLFWLHKFYDATSCSRASLASFLLRDVWLTIEIGERKS